MLEIKDRVLLQRRADFRNTDEISDMAKLKISCYSTLFQKAYQSLLPVIFIKEL